MGKRSNRRQWRKGRMGMEKVDEEGEGKSKRRRVGGGREMLERMRVTNSERGRNEG